MVKKFALRHDDYDGHGGVHYVGANFHAGEGILNARTYRTEAVARSTSEFKYSGYKPVPVKVHIEEC